LENLALPFENLRSLGCRSRDFGKIKLHPELARIPLNNRISLNRARACRQFKKAHGTMSEERAKYWGKIEEADAERVESVLQEGEKEEPRRIPFVEITVADTPEIRAVRESVERVIYVMHTWS
jgi:hypothetical protein